MTGVQSSGGGSQGMSTFVAWVPFILCFLVLYFLLIRPQQKRQKDYQKMLSELKKGDNIVTSGGILGSISGFKENGEIVIVKIAEGTKIEVERQTIASVKRT